MGQEPKKTMTSKASGAPELTLQDWGIRLGIAVLASVLMAIVGPFTTYERFTFLERLLFWGVLILGLVIPACFIRKITFQLIPGPRLRVDTIAAFVIAGVIAPPVWAFNAFWMEFDVANVMGLIEHFGICLVSCLMPVGIRYYALSTVENIEPPVEKFEPVQEVADNSSHVFMRRLDPEYGGALKRVTAADHQLLVCTSRGQTRIRMRFTDALEELADLPGSRIQEKTRQLPGQSQSRVRNRTQFHPH